MKCPPLPDPVADALARHPAPVRARLMEVREIIFAVAAETEGVGPLTETLKWGEPAYLTEATRSGTTIRLGATRARPTDCAVFFNCQTTLVDTFRSQFADAFDFEGSRALVMPIDRALPLEPLSICLRAALTYHQRKGRARRKSLAKIT